MNIRYSVVALVATILFIHSGIAAAHHNPGHGGGPGGATATPTPEPTATPPGGGSLGDMHVSFVTTTFGSTQDTYGTCKVGVVDSSGVLIDGAEVAVDATAPWAGSYTELTQEQTPGLGNVLAYFEWRLNKRNSCGKRGVPTHFTCTVTSVYHHDYTYVPSLNVETSETDTCLDGPVNIMW